MDDLYLQEEPVDLSTDELFQSDNEPLYSKYNQQTNAAADIFGGTIAAVTDFGASVFNSLVPESMETSTENLLSRIDNNALRVYEENPDLIHTASFIGGMFAPAGLALKGMNAMRTGSKAVNWFTNAGRESRIADIGKLFADAQAGTPVFTAANRGLWGAAAANGLADAAAMEGAIVMAMNDHPFMEDYMKDPLKNFAIGVGIGGVIGAPLQIVADRYAARMAMAGVSKDATKTMLDAMVEPAEFSANMSGKIAHLSANIDNWESLLAKSKTAEEGALNPYTQELLQESITYNKAAMINTFEEMASPELRALSADFRDTIIERMAKDPAKWEGVDSILYPVAKEWASMSDTPGKLFSSTKIPKKFDELGEAEEWYSIPLTKDITRGANKGEQKAAPVIYSPEFDAFYSAKELKEFGTAVDLGLTPKILDDQLRTLDTRFYTKPRTDQDLAIRSMSSPAIDADYIRALKFYDGKSFEELKAAAISPKDIPQMQAMLVRMEKLDPADRNALRFKLTETQPNWNAMEKQIVNRAQAEGAQISSKYLDDIKAFTEGDAYRSFDAWRDASLSPAAKGLIGEWIGGSGIGKFRRAVEDMLRPSGYIGITSKADDIAAVKEIYNSSASKALRAKFAGVADNQGNVYLYRGMTSDAKGHHAIESYTASFEKAKEFRNVKLYKVAVKDIFAGITDQVGKKANEILVMSPTRETAVISKEALAADKAFTQNVIEANTGKTNIEADYGMLLTRLLASKENLIREMAAEGKGIEQIAITTNTPVDVVKAVMFGQAPGLLEAESAVGQSWIKYNSADMITDYLSPARRSLLLKTDMNKVPLAKMKSNVQQGMAADMNNIILDGILSSSNSQIIKDMHSYWTSPDRQGQVAALRANLHEFVNENMGSKFVSSTNFTFRDMGAAGKIITILGKDVMEQSNRHIESILGPRSPLFASILKDKASQIEFNTARAVHAKLAGYKEFRDGKFFVQDANKPWKEVPTGKLKKDGTPVTKKERNMVEAEWQGKPFEIKTPEVKTAFEELQKMGRELYEAHTTTRKAMGMPPVNDTGFWIPAFNPRDKYIAYVWNKADGSTTLLHGKSPETLEGAIKAYERTIPVGNTNIQVVRSGKDQALYNKIAGRHDDIFMQSADINSFHSGASTPAIVSTGSDDIIDILHGYDHYIRNTIRKVTELELYDVVDQFKFMSHLSQHKVAEQPVGYIQKVLHQPKDVGAVARNTLFGTSNLDQYVGWRDFQNSMKTVAEHSLQTIQEVMMPMLHPLNKASGKTRAASDAEYGKVMAELKARGIPNPYQAFDDALGFGSKEAMDLFHMGRTKVPDKLTERVVALSNNLMATSLLKFGELAQPLVNAISLPILMSSAIQARQAEHFMGATLNKTARFGIADTMFNGTRWMFSKEGKAFLAKAEAEGITKGMISEMNGLMVQSRNLEPGAMTSLENALESKLVKIMSKPAEMSEDMVRHLSLSIGAYHAKKLYPGLSDAGIMTFARDFMDTSLGNYVASQRPTVFQGTLGVAMGLFQTYMTTLAQNIYRNVELREFKKLAKTMLTQSTIFGAGSLPGFHIVSEVIGEHFSDQNVDLTTGLYRALPEEAALILYGIPSNLGPSFNTRGDINPRIPNIAGGLDNLAAVNFMKSVYQSGDRLVQAATSAGDVSAARAIGEALSLQSISRPVARISELFTGNSITSKGNIVQGPEEVYTVPGVMARVLSTRPIGESRIRDAIHLNTVYGRIDHDARQKVMMEVKSRLRGGTLTEEAVASLGEEYMRTGSPSGWRSALNTAMAQVNEPTAKSVRKYLDPRSPTNMMIDSLDGE